MLNLTAHDRCDRCVARATHVATKFGLTDLLFCGHHIHKHEDALLNQGWAVVSDESPAQPVPTAAYTE